MLGQRIIYSVLVCLCLAACAAERPVDRAGTPGTVFVTSNGWHSGIVVARRQLSLEEVPEIRDFPHAAYFEFGWGDAEFYPAERTTVWMALRAGLVPTPAVVHLVPRDSPPAVDGAGAVALAVPDMRRLTGFLAASFDRSGERETKPGLYPNSRFYPATGRFHLANTCNSWTARGLRAAGLDIDQAAAARAEDLMAQLRPLAVPPLDR